MSGTFICEGCGGKFEKVWSDEEAKAEARMQFPDAPDDDYATVCTQCYEDFMAWYRRSAKPRHTESGDENA